MQQTNKKRRFNIIDLLITAIILAVVAFLAYVFVFNNTFSSGDSNTVKIQYVLEAREQHDMLIGPASKNVGKQLIDAASKYQLGTIQEFYTEPVVLSTYSAETGEATTSDYPEHSNFYFVVEAEAQKSPKNNRYLIDGFELAVGSIVYTRMPYYTSSSYCIQINEISE